MSGNEIFFTHSLSCWKKHLPFI